DEEQPVKKVKTEEEATNDGHKSNMTIEDLPEDAKLLLLKEKYSLEEILNLVAVNSEWERLVQRESRCHPQMTIEVQPTIVDNHNAKPIERVLDLDDDGVNHIKLLLDYVINLDDI